MEIRGIFQSMFPIEEGGYYNYAFYKDQVHWCSIKDYSVIYNVFVVIAYIFLVLHKYQKDMLMIVLKLNN